METWQSTTRLTFDGPACYQIYVRGRVWESWRDRLDGMVITQTETVDATPISILVGDLEDQAALVGVLNTLYTMHLPVLSVQYLSAGASQPAPNS